MSSSNAEQWHCRICGATNDGERSACWSCQSPRSSHKEKSNWKLHEHYSRAAKLPRRALLAGGLAGAGALFIGGFLWYTHAASSALSSYTPMLGNTSFISPYLTWSPRLTYVAIAEADSNAHNNRLEIHEGRTQQLISAFDKREWGDIYWSPDETRLLLAGARADIWRVTDGKQVGQIEFVEIPNTVAWSLDGQYITSSNLGKLQIWSVIDGKRLFIHPLPAVSDPSADADPIALAWSPDNRFLAFAGGFWSRQGYGMLGVIGGIWDVDTPGRVRDISATLQKGTDGVDRGALAWSPDGAHIAIGNGGGTLGILNVSDMNITSLVKRNFDFGAWPVAWSPNGKFLAACGKNTIEVWRIADARKVQSIEIESGFSGVPALAWTVDGSQLMAVDNSRKIQTWKVG